MLAELTRESVRIPGPRGALTGELAYGDGRPTAAGLLINPHPYMGGRMSNPLIARLAADLPRAGVVTLRFDYAGVGKSDGGDLDVYASMSRFWATGSAPEDPLMVEDARAAATWLRSQVDTGMFLIGYSFGGYAATTLLDDGLSGIALISPTLRRHDFSGLGRSAVPKLIVYGDDDFATPAEVTRRWVGTLSRVWASHGLQGGNHFFRGQEARVADLCAAFISHVVGASP